MSKILHILLFLAATIGSGQKFELNKILETHSDPIIREVASNPDKYQAQIIYSRTPDGLRFIDYKYNILADNYFYPASLAKLPLCILSYEKTNLLKNLAVIPLDAQLITYSPYTVPLTYQISDSTKIHLSIKHHIERCLVTSDNSSPNYLYEFLGHQYIQERIKAWGFDQIKINQRFYTADTIRNRITNLVNLVSPLGDTIYRQAADTSDFKTEVKSILVGNKHYNPQNKLVKKPRDFGIENNIPLESIHLLWRQVCFPKVPSNIVLSPIQKLELRNIASLLPNQCPYPNYFHYADNYRKFLYYGDTLIPIPSHIKIANKVGLAYGFISDISTFKDMITNIEFSLSAVLYVNGNNIINDGRYEYEKVGLPFLGKLGRLIYDYELFLYSYKVKSPYYHIQKAKSLYRFSKQRPVKR